MDEPSTILGPNHRKFRHDPNSTPYIAKQLFGPLADQACLDHIRLDELDRRRKGIGKMRVSVREQRQTKMQHPIFYAFWTLMNLLIGIAVFSNPYSSWGAIAFFIIAFLCFLAFLASLSKPIEKEAMPGYKMKGEVSTWESFKTCPNCGTKYKTELEKCPNCGWK
jgi:hypothetical protein